MHICKPGNENAYPFLLTATLVPSATSTYFHPNQVNVITENTEGSFNVWPKDICMSTQLVPYDPETKDKTKGIYNFIYNTKSNKYEFETTKDSVSLDTVNNLVNGSGHDLCGPRWYFTETIGGAMVSFASVVQTNEPPVVAIQSSFWQFRGLWQIVLKTQLEWYPHLFAKQIFMVSLYGMEKTLPVEKKYHKITGLATVWTFLPFTMKPNDGRWSLGYALEYKRVYQDEKSFKPAPSWIQLDSNLLEVTVKTGNFNFEGDWHVRVKSYVVEHPDITAFGEPILLTLGKDDPPVEVTNVPYFTKKLENFVMTQQYAYDKGWEYELPEIKDDDEGETVRV